MVSANLLGILFEIYRLCKLWEFVSHDPYRRKMSIVLAFSRTL